MDTNNYEFSGAIRPKTHPWRKVAEIAAIQHAVVAAWQLIELGYTRDWIKHQLAAGRLHPIHRGVYAVGHRRINRRGHWMAATLACGPLSLLSHRTAAALHGLLYPRDGWPHVTVVAKGRRRRGIVIHHVSALPERTVIDGIPTTTIPRVLLDLAHSRDPLLPYAIETAYDDGLLDMNAIEAHGPAKGIRALRSAIATYEPTPHWTRSRLEKRFYRLCRKHGLPLPAVNAWVEGYEVDMVWREQRVIVELDTDATHGTKSARRKTRSATPSSSSPATSFMRVTDDRLIHDPAGVIADLNRAVTRAG